MGNFVYIDVKEGAQYLPVYATDGSAAADIQSIKSYAIEPGERVLVETDLYFQIPEGYEIQIRSRSGLAWKHGVVVLNAPGTIDSDYRGEIKVILINMGKETYVIEKGDRVAQMVVAPVVQARFDLVEFIKDSTRGSGGFGSTGK